jgi:hypothetical protein
MFVGTLIAFDPIQDLYEILYNDDDVEELTWVELDKLLRVSGDTVTAPGAVPPLCQEAPTTMTQAAALQLQKNLLAKDGHTSSSTAAAQAQKSVQLRLSTSESDSTVCGGTRITAHNTRRTANPVGLQLPLMDVAPIRKSPRKHVACEAMLNIASQFASSESDEEFRPSQEGTEELLSSSSSDDEEHQAVVPWNDKAKKQRLQQVLTSLHNRLNIQFLHSG